RRRRRRRRSRATTRWSSSATWSTSSSPRKRSGRGRGIWANSADSKTKDQRRKTQDQRREGGGRKIVALFLFVRPARTGTPGRGTNVETSRHETARHY